MALFDDVKNYLRIDSSDNSFDTEIYDLIAASQTDLIEVGLNPIMVNNPIPDPLIKKAITTYCKANFGYDNDTMQKLGDSYTEIKIKLMNTPDYQAV